MSMSGTVHTKGHRIVFTTLAEKRRALGIRQSKAAKKLRVSQTWIARIESGARRVDVVEFVRLTRLLKIDPHKLLNRVMREVR